jgi:hypothetical protein
MILILVSDHGNLEAGKHNTGASPEMIDPPARRQSHIALLLTGGIVESNMEDLTPVHEPVGQTGVAELVRWITSPEGPEVQLETPDILSWTPQWPVLSDQNESLFLPALHQSINKSDLSVDLTEPQDTHGDLLPDVDPYARDAAIVYKVLTESQVGEPSREGDQAPFKNRTSLRDAD